MLSRLFGDQDCFSRNERERERREGGEEERGGREERR